eukprot:TRINITY_DN15838_c0_g1_i1.p2 TRINITY_DN15838_c0_g1~~TRINITY_DN15838_c0_g1_i1.p2  ORF type:complete len:106 (-),score=14.02 TRINITY_DN15838_c0_g1_i1:300-617(-)
MAGKGTCEEVRTCQDCGKKLFIKASPDTPVLTKDQLLHNSEVLSSNQNVSDLFRYPICFDCIDHMIDEAEKSIRNCEQISQEYRIGIDTITEETKFLPCTPIKGS